jgi:hypothetical protein
VVAGAAGVASEFANGVADGVAIGVVVAVVVGVAVVVVGRRPPATIRPIAATRTMRPLVMKNFFKAGPWVIRGNALM